MTKIETNTMIVGKNLSSILSYLKMSAKTAAEEIGISYNTLSNIKNGNFPISASTKEKLETFLKKYNLDIDLLYKEEKSVCNFRLRISKPLSGNEKSSVRNAIVKIERLLSVIDTLEHRNSLELFKYFDVYTWPYKDISLFDTTQRLSRFREIILEKIRTPHQWAVYFLKPEDKEFWGNLYFGVLPFQRGFNIVYLIECLGIRIHYMSFGTEKIEACSTSLMANNAKSLDSPLWAEPSIFINTDVCNTVENCLLAVTKEFYHMISDYQDYDILSYTDFKLEMQKNEQAAELFAKELLLPEDELKNCIENGKKKNFFLDDLTGLKQHFRVGYQVLIERLTELKLCNFTPSDYLEYLHSFYEDCEDKLLFRNSEPEPLSPSNNSYKIEDFFDIAILAAYERKILSRKECAEYLDCAEEAVEEKKKTNFSSINTILED